MIRHSLRVVLFVAMIAPWTALVGCNTAASTKPQRKDASDSASVHSTLDSSFDTPQAVFDAARAAAQKDDIPRILECHSHETIDSAATYVIMGAAMMRLVADKFAERGDDRYATSKKRVDSILDKYCVDLSNISADDLQPGNTNVEPFRQLAAAIDNRLAFIAELLTALETAKGTETTGFQDELTGELVDVSIRGSFAEGNVVRSEHGKQVSKPIFFKKTEGGWRIHMPDANTPPSKHSAFTKS